MKEKLTLQTAIDKGLSMNDAVRYYWPEADEIFIAFMLWERTCHPFSVEIALDQLYENYENELKANEPTLHLKFKRHCLSNNR